MLLTGDIETEAENDLVANNDVLPLKADILKVAHHGSDTSSTYHFVEAVSPQYAVVSCSSKGDRTYPHVETAMTLFDCGVEDVFTTEVCGDIATQIQDDGTIQIIYDKK